MPDPMSPQPTTPTLSSSTVKRSPFLPGRSTAVCSESRVTGEHRMHEVRAGLCQGSLERDGELLGRLDTSGLDAHALSQSYKVELRIRQVDKRSSLRAAGFGADPLQLQVQYRISGVVEKHRGDVEAFPGLGPESLD